MEDGYKVKMGYTAYGVKRDTISLYPSIAVSSRFAETHFAES